MQMSHTNFLLVFSSLCFLYPSILSFYKSHYIHSILCFQSSIFSTLYWYNTTYTTYTNYQYFWYKRVGDCLGLFLKGHTQ